MRRVPICDDGLFLLREVSSAGPVASEEIGPGALLDITGQLGRWERRLLASGAPIRQCTRSAP